MQNPIDHIEYRTADGYGTDIRSGTEMSRDGQVSPAEGNGDIGKDGRESDVQYLFVVWLIHDGHLLAE